MGELWDIYDANREKTGRKAERDAVKLYLANFILSISATLRKLNFPISCHSFN